MLAFSLFLSLPLSLYLSLPHSPHPCVCLSLSPSLPPSMCLSRLFLYLSLSLPLSPSLFLYLSLSLPLYALLRLSLPCLSVIRADEAGRWHSALRMHEGGESASYQCVLLTHTHTHMHTYSLSLAHTYTRAHMATHTHTNGTCMTRIVCVLTFRDM